MAPVSVLPGRIRYESMFLIGRKSICKRLEKRLSEIEGVKSASVNHRTGRLLVIYDARIVSDTTLADWVEKELAGKGLRVQPDPCQGEKNGTAFFSPQLAGDLVLDLVAHAFLPKPLQLLLPVAVAAFKGGVLLQAPRGTVQQL